MRLGVLASACLVVAACKGERERTAPLVEAARSCTRDSELSCPRPILSVRNLRASQAYFRDALGFHLDWEEGEPVDFASVSRGDTNVFMCQGCQGQPGSWIMVFAKNVDRLYSEFVKREAIIKMPPTDMPWGLRELHVSDPDGNVIRIGSSTRDH